MDFRISLDRWLTQTPEEYYGYDESYFEKIYDNISIEDISDADYDKYEMIFVKWENYLQQKGYTPIEAASLINRTFQKFYKNQ